MLVTMVWHASWRPGWERIGVERGVRWENDEKEDEAASNVAGRDPR